MSLYFSLKKVKSAERGSWDDLVTVCDYFWLKQIIYGDKKKQISTTLGYKDIRIRLVCDSSFC